MSENAAKSENVTEAPPIVVHDKVVTIGNRIFNWLLFLSLWLFSCSVVLWTDPVEDQTVAMTMLYSILCFFGGTILMISYAFDTKLFETKIGKVIASGGRRAGGHINSFYERHFAEAAKSLFDLIGILGSLFKWIVILSLVGIIGYVAISTIVGLPIAVLLTIIIIILLIK